MLCGMKSIKSICIGTSGWIYSDWWGIFYPEGLPQSQALEFYAQHFNTVEINATFYRFFKDKTFENWQKRVPEGFLYTLKMPRLITHLKKLKEVEKSLSRFLTQARLLKNKLGCILVQLPPGWIKDLTRLQEFLTSLPDDILFAFEFRHPSWFQEDVYETLDRKEAGFVSYHHPFMDTPRVATGKCIYVRFHGSQGLYYGQYSRKDLQSWATWVQENMAQVGKGKREAGRSTFIYFNNDAGGDAIHDALALKRILL